MSKLHKIRQEVSQEFGYIDYGDLLESISYDEPEAASALDEIAHRYAKAVTEDALKRAAENALVSTIDIGGNEYKSKSEKLAFPGDESLAKVSVDKQSILSTPINTEI